MDGVELQRVIAGSLEQARWGSLQNAAAKTIGDAGAAGHFNPVGVSDEEIQVAGIEERVLQGHLSATLQPPFPSAFIPLCHGDFDLLATGDAVEQVGDPIELPVALLELARVMVRANVGDFVSEPSQE